MVEGLEEHVPRPVPTEACGEPKVLLDEVEQDLVSVTRVDGLVTEALKTTIKGPGRLYLHAMVCWTR